MWSTSPLAVFDTKMPYRLVTSRMAVGLPVRKAQPAGLAPKLLAYCFSTSGVSRSGSTVMETNAILVPKSAPRASCTRAILSVRSGQVSVQEAKMKVRATALPR